MLIHQQGNSFIILAAKSPLSCPPRFFRHDEWESEKRKTIVTLLLEFSTDTLIL